MNGGRRWQTLIAPSKDVKSVSEPLTGIYRHYKGGMYELQSIATHSETLEPLVVYRALYGSCGVWVRPLPMWSEPVTHGGITEARFQYMAFSLDELDSKPRFQVIEDIVEYIEMDSDESEWCGFYAKEAGKVVSLERRFLGIAEDSAEHEDFSGYPEEDRAYIVLAMDICCSNHYIPLPGRRDADEYSMMEEFCSEPYNFRVAARLEQSIQGKGGFRRFKDTVARLGIEDLWNAYRDTAYRRFAREWCMENDLPWGKVFIKESFRRNQ